MPDFTLPRGSHAVTIGQDRGISWAECSCGWAARGTFREHIISRAATHDLPDYETLVDCDICGKVMPGGDCRGITHRGVHKVACSACRGVPTDPEIEKSQRFLAALLGEPYEPKP